jgi:hypothetical protein
MFKFSTFKICEDSESCSTNSLLIYHKWTWYVCLWPKWIRRHNMCFSLLSLSQNSWKFGLLILVQNTGRTFSCLGGSDLWTYLNRCWSFAINKQKGCRLWDVCLSPARRKVGKPSDMFVFALSQISAELRSSLFWLKYRDPVEMSGWSQKSSTQNAWCWDFCIGIRKRIFSPLCLFLNQKCLLIRPWVVGSFFLSDRFKSTIPLVSGLNIFTNF